MNNEHILRLAIEKSTDMYVSANGKHDSWQFNSNDLIAFAKELMRGQQAEIEQLKEALDRSYLTINKGIIHLDTKA